METACRAVQSEWAVKPEARKPAPFPLPSVLRQQVPLPCVDGGWLGGPPGRACSGLLMLESTGTI